MTFIYLHGQLSKTSCFAKATENLCLHPESSEDICTIDINYLSSALNCSLHCAEPVEAGQPPARPQQVQTTSRPRQSRAGQGKIRSLADLGAAESESDEEPNEYYTGGAKSGQVSSPEFTTKNVLQQKRLLEMETFLLPLLKASLRYHGPAFAALQ